MLRTVAWTTPRPLLLLRLCLWSICLRLAFYSMKPDGKILGCVANVIELIENEFDLFCELSCCWWGSEFDCLDEGVGILELMVESMSCFYLKNIVSEGDDVRDRLHLQLLRNLQESTNLPFLVLSGILFFVFGTGRNDVDAAFSSEDIGRFGHELRGTQFNPALCSIRDDQHNSIFDWEPEKLRRILIDLLQSLLDVVRNWNAQRLGDDLLEGNQVRCRDQSVIPIEYDDSLMGLGLCIRSQPYLLLLQLWEQSAPPIQVLFCQLLDLLLPAILVLLIVDWVGPAHTLGSVFGWVVFERYRADETTDLVGWVRSGFERAGFNLSRSGCLSLHVLKIVVVPALFFSEAWGISKSAAVQDRDVVLSGSLGSLTFLNFLDFTIQVLNLVKRIIMNILLMFIPMNHLQLKVCRYCVLRMTVVCVGNSLAHQRLKICIYFGLIVFEFSSLIFGVIPLFQSDWSRAFASTLLAFATKMPLNNRSTCPLRACSGIWYPFKGPTLPRRGCLWALPLSL